MPRQIYGAWKPDQPEHLQDGVIQADGVYPIANGYAPILQFVAATNGDLGSTCLGAAAYRTEGNVYVFAADATDLYTYSSSGFTSVKSGLSTSAQIGMRFTDYNSFMIATNGVDAIQKFDPVSPSATSDLDASAPTARFIGTIGGYLVAAYADDDPLLVKWSGNGDPTEWTLGTLNAGEQILAAGGDITGFVSGEEYGLILQENRVLRMVPDYSDGTFTMQEVATGIGCVAPWSVATGGKLTFFMSNSGIMATDGYTVQAIGAETVDRTFLDLFDREFVDNISAAVDPVLKLYFLAVPSANPASQVFIYSYGLQRWTTAPVSSQRIFPSLSQSIDLESLDDIYGDLDSIPVSLDSSLFSGGFPLMMLFDGNDTLGALSGAPMAATLTDVRRELFPGRRARALSVRPIDNANAGSVTVSTSASLSDTVTPTVYSSRTSGGIYRTRSSGNFIQVKREIPAGTEWTYAQGYDIEAVEGGRA